MIVMLDYQHNIVRQRKKDVGDGGEERGRVGGEGQSRGGESKGKQGRAEQNRESRKGRRGQRAEEKRREEGSWK